MSGLWSDTAAVRRGGVQPCRVDGRRSCSLSELKNNPLNDPPSPPWTHGSVKGQRGIVSAADRNDIHPRNCGAVTHVSFSRRSGSCGAAELRRALQRNQDAFSPPCGMFSRETRGFLFPSRL